GIWIAIPLAIVVASALVFSYGWANALVYRLAGEEPPVRGAPAPNATTEIVAPALADATRRSYDELFAIAAGHVDGWKKLTLQIPDEARSAPTLRFNIDRGNGGQPHLRQEIVLDASTGAIVEDLPFSTLSSGRKARSIIRFVHTGEVLGLAGQTVAGLVSLLSILMVWTGLALAYRRLIQPLFRKAA
ncbi:MAG: PepSY-associated TM helix domain-containing protein, partial [Woeseiaceae bacterium]